MINCKNIIKVVLLSLFICAFSFEAHCEQTIMGAGASRASTSGVSRDVPIYNNTTSSSTLQDCNPACPEGQLCSCFSDGNCRCTVDNSKSVGNQTQNPTFCSGDLGIFTDLVTTGTTIFNRLRDLIYVVAGFGIIAVAVGGFFGNLNWKWLGAIVISLVVIATAGELIVLLTGCEQFGKTLITNTLTAPTEKLDPYVNFDDSFAYAGEDGPFLESNTSDGVVD